VLAEPGPGSDRPVTQPGIMARGRTCWLDPATWRDVAYLIGLWPLLFIMDTVVLTVWLTLLAGITLPAWYWAPRGNVGLGYANDTQVHGVTLGYFPHGPLGPGGWGIHVDTLPKALVAGAVVLVSSAYYHVSCGPPGCTRGLPARCCALPQTCSSRRRRCSLVRARWAHCTQPGKAAPPPTRDQLAGGGKRQTHAPPLREGHNAPAV
jgi:hypothetical protein